MQSNDDNKHVSIMKQSAPSTIRVDGPRAFAGTNLGATGVVPSGWMDLLGKAAKGALGGLMS